MPQLSSRRNCLQRVCSLTCFSAPRVTPGEEICNLPVLSRNKTETRQLSAWSSAGQQGEQPNETDVQSTVSVITSAVTRSLFGYFGGCFKLRPVVWNVPKTSLASTYHNIQSLPFTFARLILVPDFGAFRMILKSPKTKWALWTKVYDLVRSPSVYLYLCIYSILMEALVHPVVE